MTDKSFKEQTTEERYLGLIERLNNLMVSWEMWSQDCQTKARVIEAEGAKGNHGIISGLFCRAGSVTRCRKQLEYILNRHNRAIKKKAQKHENDIPSERHDDTPGAASFGTIVRDSEV